jgi:hypothetical protein
MITQGNFSRGEKRAPPQAAVGAGRGGALRAPGTAAGGLLAEIRLRDGKILPSNAAALAGVDVLSVLVFPAAAVRLSGPSAPLRRARPAGAEQPSDSK